MLLLDLGVFTGVKDAVRGSPSWGVPLSKVGKQEERKETKT